MASPIQQIKRGSILIIIMALCFEVTRRLLLLFVFHHHCRSSNGGTNCSPISVSTAGIFNVDDFGAKGDGISDDAQAFKQAWMEACSTPGAVLLVPMTKTYLLNPITFSGPCKSTTTFQLGGKLLASAVQSDYTNSHLHWLHFSNIKNLKVQGPGTIDGNGKIWWQTSCRVNRTLPCKNAPTAVTFYNCKNLAVRNFKVQNAQQMHIVIENCTNVQASGLTVSAPESSPNTDGIHVTSSQSVNITRCNIGTGDDCISIVSGTRKVLATNIACGPGHGISIGSLGANNSQAYVSDIIVNGATFSGTASGARIKTWQGGSGTASDIKFQNLNMRNVTYPIIIDQYYCTNWNRPCKQQASAVQVRNVSYWSITGTSSSQDAIVLNCSRTVPCQGIVMQNVDLVTKGGQLSKAVCNNVKLTTIGTTSPSCA